MNIFACLLRGGILLRMEATAIKPKHFTREQIRAIRDALGLSRKQAAARLRISHRTWEHWEHGFKFPNGPCSVILEQMEEEAIIARHRAATAVA